jgi:hypothetical protein
LELVVIVTEFGASEAVPQGMQRLIGVASPSRHEESDAVEKSSAEKARRTAPESPRSRLTPGRDR